MAKLEEAKAMVGCTVAHLTHHQLPPHHQPPPPPPLIATIITTTSHHHRSPQFCQSPRHIFFLSCRMDNFLAPPQSKAFIDANSNTLVLDVQDPGSPTIPGAYQVSLGTLYFKVGLLCPALMHSTPLLVPSSPPTHVSGRTHPQTSDHHRQRNLSTATQASTDLPAIKDPKIADLQKNHPIITTCAKGGQATLGAALLVEYGFTNVKVMEGGCVRIRKELPGAFT